jgi:hypothetical protein
MAVRPVGIVAGGVDVWHDERQHGGTVPWADVDFAKRPDGTGNQAFIVLPCPVAGCDSQSVHPVSGGASRDGVQEVFARYYMRRAAALGLDAGDITKARALVRQRARELDPHLPQPGEDDVAAQASADEAE